MQAMWAGRFSKQLDHAVNDFNSSIRFDARMYEQDICGSMAHAQMLAAQGILTKADADTICDGLDAILADLKSGALEIDQTRMQVKKDGEDLLLTLTEYKILMALVKRGTVVTRDMLLEALWDEGGKFVDDNTLSVHVSRLKNKIGAQHIRTVRGVGYQWND